MRKLFNLIGKYWYVPWLLTGILAIWILLSGCAMLQNLVAPQLIYTFNYDGHEYSALLPKEVPLPPENAELVPIQYLGGIYAMHVWYIGGGRLDPIYPISSFWFTKKLGVVALVYHTLKPDGSKKRIGWLYVKGLPVPTNKKAFQKYLDELSGKQ